MPQGGGKRQTGKMPWDPGHSMVVNPLGFLYASYIPDVGLGKVASQKHQRVQTQKSPNNNCLFSSQKTRLEQARRTKLLDNNRLTIPK